eukprot:TRINITY_DN3723_c0_g2_i1.p1 TRINITY_DN3723_c0_g2~~TRINITY_DN3723_c0_g2_i1.p1  ORF type:complete len:475 (+),score=126.54 TRINITY_DN3723_c0_g2_i1:67-1425(+)
MAAPRGRGAGRGDPMQRMARVINEPAGAALGGAPEPPRRRGPVEEPEQGSYKRSTHNLADADADGHVPGSLAEAMQLFGGGGEGVQLTAEAMRDARSGGFVELKGGGDSAAFGVLDERFLEWRLRDAAQYRAAIADIRGAVVRELRAKRRRLAEEETLSFAQSGVLPAGGAAARPLPPAVQPPPRRRLQTAAAEGRQQPRPQSQQQQQEQARRAQPAAPGWDALLQRFAQEAVAEGWISSAGEGEDGCAEVLWHHGWHDAGEAATPTLPEQWERDCPLGVNTVSAAASPQGCGESVLLGAPRYAVAAGAAGLAVRCTPAADARVIGALQPGRVVTCVAAAEAAGAAGDQSVRWLKLRDGGWCPETMPGGQPALVAVDAPRGAAAARAPAAAPSAPAAECSGQLWQLWTRFVRSKAAPPAAAAPGAAADAASAPPGAADSGPDSSDEADELDL